MRQAAASVQPLGIPVLETGTPPCPPPQDRGWIRALSLDGLWVAPAPGRRRVTCQRHRCPSCGTRTCLCSRTYRKQGNRSEQRWRAVPGSGFRVDGCISLIFLWSCADMPNTRPLGPSHPSATPARSPQLVRAQTSTGCHRACPGRLLRGGMNLVRLQCS